jgi:hypothetical protein
MTPAAGGRPYYYDRQVSAQRYRDLIADTFSILGDLTRVFPGGRTRDRPLIPIGAVMAGARAGPGADRLVPSRRRWAVTANQLFPGSAANRPLSAFIGATQHAVQEVLDVAEPQAGYNAIARLSGRCRAGPR